MRVLPQARWPAKCNHCVCVLMHYVLLECICLLDGVVGLCVNYNVFTLYLCRFDIADKIDTLSLATYLQARKEGL